MTEEIREPWKPEFPPVHQTESYMSNRAAYGLISLIFGFGAFLMAVIGISAYQERDAAGIYTWLLGVVPAVIFLLLALALGIAAMRTRESND